MAAQDWRELIAIFRTVAILEVPVTETVVRSRRNRQMEDVGASSSLREE
jgi:hypothetical protein